MKVQMSSGVTASQRCFPLGGVAAGAARGEVLEARSRRRWSRSSAPPAPAAAAGRGPRGSSPSVRRPRRRRPWRRSSRARTGTPRASWSGRSARPSRRPRARRSRSRSTRDGCWRGSRPCRPWRRRGRPARGRAADRLLDLGEAAAHPRVAVLEAGPPARRRRARADARQQVRKRGRFGSPLLHGGEV